MKELTDEQKKAIEKVQTMMLEAQEVLDQVELNDVTIVLGIGAPRPHKPK